MKRDISGKFVGGADRDVPAAAPAASWASAAGRPQRPRAQAGVAAAVAAARGPAPSPRRRRAGKVKQPAELTRGEGRAASPFDARRQYIEGAFDPFKPNRAYKNLPRWDDLSPLVAQFAAEDAAGRLSPGVRIPTPLGVASYHEGLSADAYGWDEDLWGDEDVWDDEFSGLSPVDYAGFLHGGGGGGGGSSSGGGGGGSSSGGGGSSSGSGGAQPYGSSSLAPSRGGRRRVPYGMF